MDTNISEGREHSFILQEGDLGDSAKNLLIWMVIMIMSVSYVNRREVFVSVFSLALVNILFFTFSF